MNRFLLGICLLFFANQLKSQVAVSCPPNIGFEWGNFDNWDCFEGFISKDGVLDLQPSVPLPNVHTLIEKGPTPVMDPYGGFPISCPNGSGFSIRLGNDESAQGAERMSYTFQIPNNQAVFSIIYNYAVVFQDFGHSPIQQPKFTTRVFDVSDNSYIGCASFEFIATSNLPGFQKSTVDPLVYYKPWAAVTIDLNGMGGKTVRLEFTNNDCTLGGHFGYVYIDVNENCNSPVKGNVLCSNSSSMTLRAPYGFQEYKWYDATVTNLLGTNINLTLNPVPAAGTVFAVILIPYPGYGCLDTIFTDVSRVADIISLNVPDTIRGCKDPGVNLTLPSVTTGSSPGLNLSYFTDDALTQYVPSANSITTAGFYYINAVNQLGCNVTKKVYVDVAPSPTLTFSSTLWGCSPTPVDITNPMLFIGTDPGVAFSYWSNASATSTLPSPASVSTGLYYVKATNATGCATVKPMAVQLADLRTVPVKACAAADLTSPGTTAGSSTGFEFTYWKDSACTIPVTNPNAVSESGRYYIRGQHDMGTCIKVRGVDVEITAGDVFTITNPPEVKYPGNVNLANAINVSPAANITFTYWKDTFATKKLDNPNNITEAGTYYIKGRTPQGCDIIKPVEVKIKLPDPTKVEAPNAFSPNGDGVNDVFRINLEGPLRKIELRIYNRYGTLVYHTNKVVAEWNGKAGGTDVPNGTYYWTLDAEDSYRKQKVQATGSVTVIR